MDHGKKEELVDSNTYKKFKFYIEALNFTKNKLKIEALWTYVFHIKKKLWRFERNYSFFFYLYNRIFLSWVSSSSDQRLHFPSEESHNYNLTIKKDYLGMGFGQKMVILDISWRY